MIGRTKCNKKNFPRKIIKENNVVTDTEVTAKHFNTFFTEIGLKLAKAIETPAKTFETYLQKYKIRQPENPLTITELKDAFFSLQTNKSLGYDGISFNVIKYCFEPLSTSLLNIFNLSLEKGIFPDELKIARVTLISKTSDENDFGNYRPISVLPCFSKMLERIIYKRLYNHLSQKPYVISETIWLSKESFNRTFNRN